MRSFTLIAFLLCLGVAGHAKTWVINNSGFTFTPATITIELGDSVRFTVAGIHKPIEVSQTTWDNNDNTPLNGGFNLPNGGGLLVPSQLGVGTHFYVCQPHAGMGMKGKIIVENTTSVNPQPGAANISIFPNPNSGKFQLEVERTDSPKNYNLDVFDMQGKKVYSLQQVKQQTLYEVNLTGYDKGIYTLILSEGTLTYSRKVVVQ